MRPLREKIPPLRQDPFQPDEAGLDARRVEYAWQLWKRQDMALAARDRQIEENIRMLAGRHWSVWSRLLGKFIDLNEILEDKERLWRQRPVFNHVLDWFLLTHARVTENPPIISFQPSTPDREDAEAAEIMDTIYKSLWQDVGMLEVLDRFAAILVPSGSAHLVSRVDPLQGEIIEWRGPALLQDEIGGELVTRIVPDVPFDQAGNPLARLTGPGPDDWEATGKAYAEHEGGIVVDAVSPIAVRGQWGHDIPWHRKSWHARRLFLTPEEVLLTYGVELEPDVTGEDVARMGELRRLVHGSGHYGAAEYGIHSILTGNQDASEGFCDILELWHRPLPFPGMERTQDDPGGRLLTVSRSQVLRDGPRPADFQYVSPIRRVDFIGIPGRPSGSTPQESMNALNRTYNRQWANLLEHGHKNSHPITLIDQGSGLKDGDVTNEPGLHLYINRRMGTTAPPIEYAKMPELGESVYRIISMTKEELRDRGYTEGALGRPPTRDPSGELVKELRFNADRYIGPTSRRLVIELARMVEDWQVILPTIWTEEKVISWAGKDQMLRTIIYRPELFRQGSVNVVPDIESMLPEGRGERQARIRADWQAGAFGPPDSPEAIRQYLELARFPHMGRAVRPGGIHRVMAERENARLVQGFPAEAVPILEWHNHEVHLAVLEEFMAGPDYLELPVEIQEQFAFHRQGHLQAMEAVALTQAQREGRMAAAEGQVAAAVQGEVADASFGMDPNLPEDPRSVESPEGRPPGGRPIPATRAS
jgi:hypothetical protein